MTDAQFSNPESHSDIPLYLLISPVQSPLSAVPSRHLILNMVMERLRNFALRKRHPRATASPFASPSAGHTLVKHDASLDPSLNLPPSVQSNSEADQDVFGVASLRSMSTQTNVKPPQANKLTQTETSSLKCPQSHQSVDDKDAEPKKLAVKPYNKKAPANEHHLVVDAHLLAMAATLIADSDTILRSGLAVSQTLDDTAQDAREAMTAINQIEGESTLLTKQMEIMQLKFNSAYVQLSNARSILRSILDHRAVANRHTVVMAGMLQSLLEIQQMITNEEGEASQWPIDRVHDILSVCPKSVSYLYLSTNGCY